MQFEHVDAAVYGFRGKSRVVPTPIQISRGCPAAANSVTAAVQSSRCATALAHRKSADGVAVEGAICAMVLSAL